MEALHRSSASAEALFLEVWGEGGQSIAKRPSVHVIAQRQMQLELLRRDWDAVILVDTPEFLEVLAEADVRCPVLFETHASYLPALDYYHSSMGDPLISAAIAPSAFNKQLLMAGGCDEDDIHVIPNTLDAAVFSLVPRRESSDIEGLPDGIPLVLNVGRLEPQKNTLEFVRIACELLADGKAAHFVIVGDSVGTSDYSAQVHAAVSAQSQDRFTFIPRVDYEDMQQLYLRAAKSGGCLIVSSLNESQPMTILEAMACRCSVVAARVGGIGEAVFDSVTGRLYESGDVAAASSAVRQFLDDAGFRERVIEQAWAYVQLEHSSKRTAELYVALIKKSKSTPKNPKLLKAGSAGKTASAPKTSGANRQLAARLDALVGEFVALHSDMLVSQDRSPSISEKAIKALFSEPLLASNEAPVTAYADVVPGIRIGFEATSNVLLTVQPKEDFSRSPESCLKTITMRFSGTSRWLTLELSISWDEFREATRYQFGLYGQPDRPMSGQAVLRLPLKEGWFRRSSFSGVPAFGNRQELPQAWRATTAGSVRSRPGATAHAAPLLRLEVRPGSAARLPDDLLFITSA